MFGGTRHGESTAHTHATAPAASGRRASSTRIALVLPAVATICVGFALVTGLGGGSSESLVVGRHILLTTGGALCFGAGLLQLATWRMRHQPRLAYRGGLFTVAGLMVASATQLVRGWPVSASTTHETLRWAFTSSVLWSVVSTLVLTACLAAFLEAAAEEEDRLSSAELALSAAAEASRCQEQEQRNLRHDARNALCALRMATQALAEIGDQLDQETRGRLRSAVLEEVGHLDDLIRRTAVPQIAAGGVAKEWLPLGRLPKQRHATEGRSAEVGA